MSLFAPQDYNDRRADARAEGCDADTARRYAGGAQPLRAFIGDEPEEGDDFLNLDDADAPKRRAEELRADSDREKEAYEGNA